MVHFLSVTAGNCLSDQSDEPLAPPLPPYKEGKLCPELWACEDPNLDFPTVECLLADVKTCGIIGANGAPTIMYSFGVTDGNIAKFHDPIVPEGNIYRDMLDGPYWTQAITHTNLKDKTKHDPFKLGVPARVDVLIARSAEAYAASASGEVLVFIGQQKGTVEGDTMLGIFQKPFVDPKNPNPDPSMLQTYEIPILQRNPTVTRIVSIDVSNNFQRDVDWENGQSPPGLDNPLLPLGEADNIPVPPVPAGMRKSRRDGNSTEDGADPPTLCPIAVADAVATPSSISPSPTSKPSCVLHEQDPDQGITQAFCLCDSTATLSRLSAASTGGPSDSCAYTTIPATAKEAVTTFTSTYTKNCQGCTQVGFNAPSCTTVPQCTPTSAEVTVQAGSSPVHVGTLTGTALHTSVSSALEKLCPSVTQAMSSTACETGSVTIPNTDFVSDESLDSDGELVIKAAASSYNSTALRDAMIKSAQKGSKQPSSCYNQSYTVMGRQDPMPRTCI
ncbi:uncharacterized protein Z518_04924 [Rhinocladiella mackenziei CBS 650.93]|uniref:Uncharacterized protein n=1 Tax=Rhinocladiella mackenziei CBS 650.93 TaxID=1442369 RepID=A0A0D2H8Z7_9EURO|nr:uncharacterized protein Z518_04924 [Rhinocladiella mackenziei CBS 650.93]KIX06948.1 hypothetical protein Z518_04924 [Rhinocladiella mackenziei CBS 650.93]